MLSSLAGQEISAPLVDHVAGDYRGRIEEGVGDKGKMGRQLENMDLKRTKQNGASLP